MATLGQKRLISSVERLHQTEELHGNKKITKRLEKVKFQRPEKALQRYLGFLIYYQNYIPLLPKRPHLFFQLTKTTKNENKIIITTELMSEIWEVNDALDNCYQLVIDNR